MTLSSVDKISMVLCVRLHEGNPWVLDRLEFLLSYYNPKPAIYVLDYGSERRFAELIQGICKENSASYIYHEDCDIYSAAIARNTAAQHVQSEYLFLSDIDCVGEIDLFARFGKLINSVNSKRLNTYVLPVYHLGKDTTSDLISYFSSSISFDEKITSCFADAIHAAYNGDESYIAPYSNVFLIHRDIFKECGGYDPRFKGHGSEDFEFLLRLGIHLKISPVPSHVEADCFGPLTPDFFDVTPYRGFRKLFEAMSAPAELAGLRVVHLWHPRPMEVTWHGENDSSRSRFFEVVSKYLSNVDQEELATNSKTHDRSYIAYRTKFFDRKEVLYSILSNSDYKNLEIVASKEFHNKNFGLAGSIFIRSFECNSNRVTPLISAYGCFLRSGNYTAALSCIRAAYKLRPKSKKIRSKLIFVRTLRFIMRPFENEMNMRALPSKRSLAV